jgi:hypothetical protein
MTYILYTSRRIHEYGYLIERAVGTQLRRCRRQKELVGPGGIAVI